MKEAEAVKKMVIADSNEEFRKGMSELLQNDLEISEAENGTEALQQLEKYRCDLLALDLMLPEIDGITVIQKAKAMNPDLRILTFTRFVSPYVISKLQQLQVNYAMMKPCSLKAAASRVRELAQPEIRTDHVLAADTEDLLMRLGISRRLLGFSYICDAVRLLEARPSMSITKELYPEVAVLYHASAAQVEHSIRTAIDSGWHRGKPAEWNMLLNLSPDVHTSRPSNGLFLSSAAEKLKQEQTFEILSVRRA